jgi:NADH:ubiquinone oxidoreductase subunit 6 (subunit J)
VALCLEIEVWEVLMLYMWFVDATWLAIVAIIFAIQAIRAKRLIVSALWLASVSAVLSIMFYVMGGYQVAAIELSVGAGLVTVLFVFAIGIAGDEVMDVRSLLPKPLAWGLVILSVVLLGFFAPSLDADVQPLSEPSLASVLWQQRGLDVLVQIVLIFAGVLGLLGLLAETKAPLAQAVAEEVAAERDRELEAMTQQVMEREKETV